METEKYNRILEDRKKWYQQTFVKFELISCLKHRELCFLTAKGEEKKKAVRYLLAFSTQYLDKHFQWFNFDKTLLNMYHSVAVLKDVPVFSYNISERKKEEKYQEFDQNYKSYVSGYEFFADIDGKEDFKLAHQEAKQFKKLFDEYKLPYYIVNSSDCGFHFIIPYDYMPDIPISSTLDLLNEVIYNIQGIYDLKTLDTSVIDMKRVKKLPYSFVCPSGVICLPLTDWQFENFTPELVGSNNVLKYFKIKFRGLLTRTWGLSKEELRRNVEKFIKDFK